MDFRIPVEREKELPAGFKPYRIEVSGLIGGHSGEDIHMGRGSAIELVLRVSEASGLPLVSIASIVKIYEFLTELLSNL